MIDDSGETIEVFQLRQSAMVPLVDVARVFGFAAGRAFGASTLERFSLVREMLPQHTELFDSAAESFRIVLSLQARVGIRQQSTGFELPPSLLSRHDRQLLKKSFQSILRLLEFTANYRWPEQS